jgi:hypothetical protein
VICVFPRTSARIINDFQNILFGFYVYVCTKGLSTVLARGLTDHDTANAVQQSVRAAISAQCFIKEPVDDSKCASFLRCTEYSVQ